MSVQAAVTAAVPWKWIAFALAGAIAGAAPAWGTGDSADAVRGDVAVLGLGSDPASTLSLDACLARAQEMNPRLAASRASWMAAVARVDRVRSLPDPTVTYSHYIDEIETRVGPQTRRIGVRQALPFFGKLRLGGEMARAAAEAEYQRHRAARLDVAFEVTSAFVEYAYLAQALRIASQREDLLRQLEAVTTRRYADGGASYTDVMTAQMELARARDEWESLSSQRGAASSRLTSAMGDADWGTLPWPDAIPDVGAPASDGARERLSSTSPELLRIDREIERAARSRELARRGYLPDVTVGLEYIVTDDAVAQVDDSGKDPLIASVSLAVPLWFGKHRAAVREAASALSASRFTQAQRENELRALLDRALYETVDAERRVRLYEVELFPRARQALASVDAAYRAGSSDFGSLIAAERTALEFELALARARADRSVASAELARLLGDGVPARPPGE
jgi:cobalt-zinc-cadmium efflux system outer membrane protein